jgi:uncharacterized protein YndB with AHSA1/START domain
MARAYASSVIDAPADRVWALIRDFNGLPDWHGGLVRSSEIEGGLRGDTVGGVRSFHLHDGTHLRERLLAHSDRDRSYTYNFEKSPFDVQNYEATLRVTPVTDGDRSFVEWWTTFDCEPRRLDEWVAFFAGQVFLPGIRAIAARLQR